MTLDDAAVREAYRRGAHDAYESAVPFVDMRRERAILDWFTELDVWTKGEPPPAPVFWQPVND